jgi:hypothetical protein
VLARFAQNSAELTDLASQSRAESAAIKDEVCGSLVQLQFQDRVSQILSHVVSSMERLSEQPNEPGSAGFSSERPGSTLGKRRPLTPPTSSGEITRTSRLMQSRRKR